MRRAVAAAIGCSLLTLSACKSDQKKQTDEKKQEKASAEKAESDQTGEEKGAAKTSGDDEGADLTEEVKTAETTTVKGGKCDSPKKLTELKKHTVLSAEDGGCFLVDDVLELENKEEKLTVEAGVTVKFAENAGLRVRRAAFEAEGTSNEPVVFTGQRKKSGFWKGIDIQETDRSANRFEHVHIKYAGNDSTFDGVKPAGLMFDDYHGPSSFTIRKTTISHSQGHGLYVEGDTDLEFADNTLTDNEAGAARVAPGAIGELDATSSYEGNGKDRVTVEGGTLKKHEATWPGLDVPYRVLESIEVSGESYITVEPGATFEFTENTGVSFRQSKLDAVGNEEAPIRWTGAREIAGIWRGIVFRQTDSIDNKLEHNVVSYAGGDDNFEGIEPAAVMFDDYHGKSSFAIRHSTFSHSAGYGLYVEQKTDLTFAENTMTKNEKGAARIHPEVLGALDAKSTYSGNEQDRVHVPGATVKGVEATWPAIDVPYVFEKTVNFEKESHLTLSPGITLKFAEKQGLTFRQSKLTAKGTADKPITLTGTREVAGFWGGLVFRQTTSIDNVLEHVTVEYAGASKAFDGVEPAGLLFDDYHGPVSFRVAHLTVRNSGGAGLHLEKKVELKSEDCGTVTLEADPKVTEASRPFEKVCGKP